MIAHRVAIGAGVGLAVASAYGTLHRLGRTAGSRAEERAAALPGDELVPRPQIVTDHAATIEAPPAETWPWLVQVGWHRGGWYTARWVDRLLFPANGAAADRIHPEWQHLAVGDRVPDGPPESECWFVVTELEPEHHLVLHSRSHLPPELRNRFHASIDWSWTFALRKLPGGRTRFHLRTRVRLSPTWLAVAYWALLIPADAVMARQMLTGLAARATGQRATVVSSAGVSVEAERAVGPTPATAVAAVETAGRGRRAEAARPGPTTR
jgi:hypothetical protein